MKNREIYCLNNISRVGTGRFRKGYTLVDEIDHAAGVLVRSADMKAMDFPPTLRAIGRAGAGVNNIPLDRCAEQGIVVFNTPGANANAVKELVIAGEYENYEPGYKYFSRVAELDYIGMERLGIAINMAAICAARRGDNIGFMKYALRAAAGNIMTSELACELGTYYESMHDLNEACMWYYNALRECEPAMDINYGAKVPAEAMERLGVDATIYLDRE